MKAALRTLACLAALAACSFAWLTLFGCDVGASDKIAAPVLIALGLSGLMSASMLWALWRAGLLNPVTISSPCYGGGCLATLVMGTIATFLAVAPLLAIWLAIPHELMPPPDSTAPIVRIIFLVTDLIWAICASWWSLRPIFARTSPG